MYQAEGFILSEGIGKRIPSDSILDFVILSDFKMRSEALIY